MLRYKIPTRSGQSGSPIIKRIGDKYYVIGIHIACEKENEDKINIGVRLTN